MPAAIVHPESAIVIPESVRAAAEKSVGEFFESISKTPSSTAADDHLNVEKSIKRAQLLERFEPLRNKKLLEIGSGYGVNLATWIKSYQVDGYGAEPDGVGFGTSFSSSRELFVANGIDPERIQPAKGENLPFEDASFEIVYSANVLEHTEDLAFRDAKLPLIFRGPLHGAATADSVAIVATPMASSAGTGSVVCAYDSNRDQPRMVSPRRKASEQEISCQTAFPWRRDFPRSTGAAFSF
jgi:SAM-dependent methyltransferase